MNILADDGLNQGPNWVVVPGIGPYETCAGAFLFDNPRER